MLLGLALLLAHAPLAAAQDPRTRVVREVSDEEQPPTLVGLWLSIGLLVVIAVAVVALQRRRARRAELARWAAAAPAPLRPAPRAARRRAVQEAHHLIRDVDDAWARRDGVRLRELAAPALAARWSANVNGGPGRRIDEYRPIAVACVGALDPAPGEDERVLVRVQASVRDLEPAGDDAGPGRGWLAGAIPQPSAPGTRWQRWRRAVIAVSVAAVVVVSLAVVLGRTLELGGGEAPAPPAVLARGGAPVGEPRVLSFRLGDRIAFEVRSDASDRVRFEGYDVRRDVAPGRPARFDVYAGIEGVFAVVLERSGRTVAVVRVRG